MDEKPPEKRWDHGAIINSPEVHKFELTPAEVEKLKADFRAKMKESAKSWPRRRKGKGK